MGYESLTEFSINQSIVIYFIAHKCMPKNFLDYLGNKVTFLKWADNGLLLAKFIEFFCRVLIRHYCNKFRKLIAKYSNDSKDHKGYKPKRILPFASVMLSSQKSHLQWWLPCLPRLSNCLSLLDTELIKREWIGILITLDEVNEVISGGSVSFVSLMHCFGNGLELPFV